MDDGRKYKEDDGVPYPVLIDDLIGTVHQVYGGLADPTYLIDADGRVSFYNMWTHAPTLHKAIEELLSQGGRGVVKGGTDRIPHLLSTIADGWHGLQRGFPRSAIELELASPGMASGPFLGYQIRPLLAPIALRATPLPVAAKIGLAVGGAALLFLGVRALSGNGKKRG
ncbi:MAG: hypothetical protein AVDCRST_MAG74-1273 [uncultured Pyrinomonadaceae bacterium]|uniref:Uncharacterized protein n=1 Tax=uncultured Pyrinomonadaceae bacterium TaxID=2283094 RepID=A0A6J4NRX4_9BACT|nr:MAG: hypothetical protein AVDCRST_MAG74-1273 [uncultured Pyrinomonadaceae bacterium]